MRYVLVSAVLAAVVLGCKGKDDSGDPGSTAGGVGGNATGGGSGTGVEQLDGVWRYRTIETDQSTSTELEGHLAVARVTTSGSTGAIEYVMSALVDGVMSGPVNEDTASFEVDGDRMIVTDTSGVQVFVVSGQDQERYLVWDDADPRNTVTGPGQLRQLTLERLPAPTIEGVWVGVSSHLGPYLTLLGQCVITDKATWTLQTLDFSVDDRGVVSALDSISMFSDDGCTKQIGATQTTESIGVYRDTVSPSGEMWTMNPGGSAWDQLSVTQDDNGTLALLRLDCEPAPDCNSQGFNDIELIPAP